MITLKQLSICIVAVMMVLLTVWYHKSKLVELQPTDEAELVSFLAEREEIFAQRRLRMVTKCKKAHINKNVTITDFTLRNNILWDHHYSISYCPVPKTGSSSWMEHFLHLLGGHLPLKIVLRYEKWFLTRQYFQLPAVFTIDEKKALIEDSKLSFMFVRHPFVRLVSAYRDKVVHMGFPGWTSKIQKAYGLGDDTTPTFEQFVDQVFKTSMKMDEHIQPASAHCDVCNINYNVIAKQETAELDVKYIVHVAGIQDKFDYETKANAMEGSSSDKLVGKYFATLPESTVQMLKEFYKNDFNMFNYDPLFFSSNDLTSDKGVN